MLSKTLSLIAASSVVVATLVACSSDDSDKYGSVQAFCDAKADALCKNVAPGCGTTAETCKPTATASCVSTGNATGRAYKASAAEDCINKTNEVYAKKTVTADDEKALDDTCAKVFPGIKLVTEACGSDDDCVEGYVCDIQVSKTCAKKNDVQITGGCSNAGDTCVKGSYCQAQGGRSFCVAKNDVGQICDATKPCLENLRCANGTCTTKNTIGQSCTVDDDCSDTASAAYCDTVSKQCKLRYTAGTQSCKDIGGS